jgi:hypothetical protein
VRWRTRLLVRPGQVSNFESDHFSSARSKKSEPQWVDNRGIPPLQRTQRWGTRQESHGQPSFAQRYTDFIATAANHVVLLTPFVLALTAMLQKVLG